MVTYIETILDQTACGIGGIEKRRRGRDSNPRGVSAHLISSQRRYDRFGTSPEKWNYISIRNLDLIY